MKIHNRLDTPNMDKWRKSQGQSTVTVLGKKRGGCGKEMLALRGRREVRRKNGLLGRAWQGGLAQDGHCGAG